MRSIWRTLDGHLLVDASVAFAIAQSDPAWRRAAYWACGLALFLAWNVAAGSTAVLRLLGVP